MSLLVYNIISCLRSRHLGIDCLFIIWIGLSAFAHTLFNGFDWFACECRKFLCHRFLLIEVSYDLQS